MDTKGNVRAALLHLLVYMFILLMVIPTVIVFKNLFDFEGRAQAMMDAIKIGETFKRDYLLALYAPVSNITICHKLPPLEPCQVSMRSAQAGKIDVSAPNKYAPILLVGIPERYQGAKRMATGTAPTVYVEIIDPAWNATVFLDLMVYGDYGSPPYLKVIEPRINGSSCQQTTIDAVNYTDCAFNCTNPIKISKVRHYSPWVGTFIDNISVEEGGSGC